MAIAGIKQPEIIQIEESLRLKAFNGVLNFALPWYNDPYLLKMVDGPTGEPYDMRGLIGMFEYLERHGEVYIIEHKMGDYFEPIGDVTYWKDDLPIVIGEKAFWGKGIGTKVVNTLLDRGRSLGYTVQAVQEIYDYNLASQRLFEGCGFEKDQRTAHGYSYRREL